MYIHPFSYLHPSLPCTLPYSAYLVLPFLPSLHSSSPFLQTLPYLLISSFPLPMRTWADTLLLEFLYPSTLPLHTIPSIQPLHPTPSIPSLHPIIPLPHSCTQSLPSLHPIPPILPSHPSHPSTPSLHPIPSPHPLNPIPPSHHPSTPSLHPIPLPHPSTPSLQHSPDALWRMLEYLCCIG